MALSREYLERKIFTARNAIAFAVPGADISYAKAILNAAETKLFELNPSNGSK